MGRWSLALLAALVVAGCVDRDAADRDPGPDELRDRCGDRPEPGGGVPDWSKEILDYNIRGQGPFTVRVPVVLSEEGSQMDDWTEPISGRGEWRAVQTDAGAALEVQADEGLHAIACSIQPAAGGNGCCAEQYLHGIWSLGPDETRPAEIFIEVMSGTVSLDIVYDAESDLCGRQAVFGGRDLQPGRHSLSGEDSAWCT